MTGQRPVRGIALVVTPPLLFNAGDHLAAMQSVPDSKLLLALGSRPAARSAHR